MEGIKYPKKQSEAEVQSILWSLLRERGLDARLQVLGNLNGRRHKFDIIVFKHGNPQVIIECKSWAKLYSEKRFNSLQIHKYKKYGLPVFICVRLESIPEVAERIFDSYFNHNFEHI